MILPDVLLIILEHLYNDERKTFSICMRVCKDWHQLARPISWKDVYLCDYNIENFANNVKSEANLDRIRSITARSIKPIYVLGRLSILSSLCQRMQHMPALVSFSCTCSFIGARCESTGAQREKLASILQSLPSTLQHLELNGYYMEHDYPLLAEDHFCLLIAKLMPQLRSLRLENMRLCSKFFEAVKSQCPSLNSISINNRFQMTRCDCGTDEATQRITFDDTIEEVLGAARALLNQGYLPSIERFVVVGCVYLDKPDVATFQNLYKADVVANTVTSYPCAQTHPGWQYTWWMRFMNHNTGAEVDLDATAAELQEFVEDSYWIQYNNGVRLPQDLQLQPHHPSQNRLAWYNNAITQAEEFRNQEGPVTKLFYWEDRVRRSLLHVQTSNGLLVPKVIRRETPVEEMYLDPNSEEGQKPKELHWIHRCFGWAQ